MRYHYKNTNSHLMHIYSKIQLSKNKKDQRDDHKSSSSCFSSSSSVSRSSTIVSRTGEVDGFSG
uniref:Uncharacterized protein n=1 Tax=Brassica oleracea var. oleracea TaxID=109376 RepID=A0A0D3AHK7_BRAOL